MKSIVYVGGFELPDRNAAAQRVLNNARVLRSLGYRVVLVGISHARAYDHKIHPADSGGADVEALEIGYPVRRSDWFNYIRTDWPVRQLAEQGIVLPGEVTTVVCYNYPALAQRAIAALAREWGAATLADCTEWYASRPWTSAANIVKNLDVPLRMYWVNRRMDGIITTSPSMSGFYRSTGLPIIEIPTLMEPQVEPLAVGELVTPLPLLAVASGFSDGARAETIHDRIDWIIELLGCAAERGARFSLRIVGADRERYLALFPQHRALLERLGDSVAFLGRQRRSEVLRLLQASAFAFVLRHESRVTLAGFPSKYSEAITYGTPCIINALPSVRPYHVEGKTGLTISLDNRTAAIQRLCEILDMDVNAIMDMKRYCLECGFFTFQAFEMRMAIFLTAVQRGVIACRSIG